MCGIIYYKGKNKCLSEIFNYAIEQQHRGKDDGHGFYDFQNGSFHKTLLSFDEILDNKVSEKRIEKYQKKSKKIQKKKVKEWKKYLENWRTLLEIAQTSEILFHHRKASMGEIKIKNTQPLFDKEKSIIYAHNGTCYGSYALKVFMEIFGKKEFVSDTDSEVLKNVYFKLLEDKDTKNNADELIGSFFDYGILFVSNQISHKILLDGTRSMYYYKGVDWEILMSEPSFQITDFVSCKKIGEGKILITKNKILLEGEVEDVTKKLSEKINEKHKEIKCDCCRDIKQCFDINGEDVCLLCWTSGEVEKKEQKIQAKYAKWKNTSIEEWQKTVDGNCISYY